MRSITTRESKSRLRSKRQAPKSAKLRSIAQDHWARPSMAMRSWRARLRMAPWRIKRGTNQSLIFHQNLYEHIYTALAFSLLFETTKRNDVLTSLSVSRSEQRAEQAQTDNTDKENPTHSFTNLFADTVSTRREGRGVVRVSCHW